MDLETKEKLYKPSLELIQKFEKELSKLPQMEIETRHFFSNGVYVREVYMPAGAVIIGKIHKDSHVNIISKGCLIVSTENGMETLEAPYTFISPANTKRILRVVEDTIWTTIHPNPDNIKDENKLEKLLIIPEENLIDWEDAKKCLG